MRCLVSVFILAIVLAISCQIGTQEKAPDAANATYTIDGRPITLSNGRAEQPAAPGSATKIVTRLADKQAVGDVNGDRRPDAALVLIHDPGGSGTFYYIAAVLNDGGPGKATDAKLLGDRIVVEKISIVDGRIVVEYLTRRDGEPLAATPSIKVTKAFTVKDGKLE